MGLALQQARRAERLGEVPIGAVVVCDGEVISRGYNRRETDGDPSAHAEFIAMRRAARKLGRWRLTGCTVYVTLEPCLMCAGLMYQARIDRCVYGAPDPKAGALGTPYSVHEDSRLNHSFAVQPGIREEECASLLREFFAMLREKSGKRGTKAPPVPDRPCETPPAAGKPCETPQTADGRPGLSQASDGKPEAPPAPGGESE